MDLNPADQQLTYDLDRQFVFHSWSAQGALKPMVFAGGQGSWMWDYEGNKYLDFTSQLVFTNIGHQHPKVVAAIAEQAAKLFQQAISQGNVRAKEQLAQLEVNFILRLFRGARGLF